MLTEKDAKDKDSIAVGGSAKGRSLASSPASARGMFPLEPCPQLKEIPESGPQQMPPKGPVALPPDQGTVVPRTGSVTVGRPQGAPDASIPDTKTDGGKSAPWKPSLRVSDKEKTVPHAAAAAPATPALKKARSGSWDKPSTSTWSDKQADQPASSDWRQLSKQVQMKVEMYCTVCGGVGHVAVNCMAAGAADTVTAGAADKPETTAEVATSVGGPPGAPPTEGGAMPPPSSCPKGKVVADAVRNESYARYRANRVAKEKGDNKGKAADHVKGKVGKGKPANFPRPEVPDASFGIGTYDAARADQAKGKSKKGKSKKDKGKMHDPTPLVGRTVGEQDSDGHWGQSWWDRGQSWRR